MHLNFITLDTQSFYCIVHGDGEWCEIEKLNVKNGS